MVRKPSDLGFSDKGYDLPPLHIHEHVLDSTKWSEGYLFPMPAATMQEERAVKRDSIADRCRAVAKLAEKGSWVIWCELNDEADELEKRVKGARQVKGDDSIFKKEEILDAFADGKLKRLITKPKIAGFGMNWQHCNNMVIANLSHSYEQFYQCIRRCWRFGQERPVNVHVFLMDSESAVLTNIKRKEREAQEMAARMVEHLKDAMKGEMGATTRQFVPYEPVKRLQLPTFIKGKSA